MKIKWILTLPLILIMLLVLIGGQQALVSETSGEIPTNNFVRGSANELLIKESETIEAIEQIGPDGKTEVKNALITKYIPVDSNAYIVASGQYPTDGQITKVVDVTFIDEGFDNKRQENQSCWE